MDLLLDATIWQKLLDAAINVFFVVAAFASGVVVILYRWKEVPVRGALIAKACKPLKDRSNPPKGKADVKKGPERTLKDYGREALRLPRLMFGKAEIDLEDPERTFERYHSYGRYSVPLVILVILQVAASFILYSWLRCKLDPGLTSCNKLNLQPVVVMALAGGIVWTLQQVIARTYDGELGPPDLYELIIGLMSAVPIGYAFSLTVDENSRLGPLLAFGASAFPVRETARLFREFMTRRMLDSTDKKGTRPTERHLGTAIDGVSDEALSRLKELRIVTVLDIAYSDPVDVMVQTGFPLMVIVDWIDQAIWALYAGDKKGVMTNHGIRCSLDVCEFVEMHLQNPNSANALVKSPDRLTPRHKAALDAAAAKMEVDGQLLMDMFFRIYSDPQVKRLRRLWYPDGLPPGLQSGGTVFDTPGADELQRDDALWELYDCSFPASEREPHDVILKTVRDEAGLVVRARSEGKTNGFSVVHLLTGPPPAVFLVYLAIRPAYRSRGLGSELFEETWRLASARQADDKPTSSGMIWEVEIPELAKTADERDGRRKRIRFFERLGASVMEAQYEQPPVDGKGTVPMHLMFKPAESALPDAAKTRSLVDAMYKEKYERQNGIDAQTIKELRVRFGTGNGVALT